MKNTSPLRLKVYDWFDGPYPAQLAIPAEYEALHAMVEETRTAA